MKHFFESDHIKFVAVSKQLVKDYLVLVNDYEHVNRFLGGRRESFSEEQELEWIEKTLADKATVFSMIGKENGSFIGNIELMDVSDSVGELGIAITAEMQNLGYGTEAVLALTKYGMDTLGLKKITIRTNPKNVRAIHVYEKCGFQQVDRTEEHVFMEYIGNKPVEKGIAGMIDAERTKL